MQFLKVWGAAEATCMRWYAAGCRTLDDVRARNDLTEQQVSHCSPCTLYHTVLYAPFLYDTQDKQSVAAACWGTWKLSTTTTNSQERRPIAICNLLACMP